MNTGRILVRALVVLGGAAAVSAIAWLSATASAGTLADGPAVGSVVDDAARPVLELSGAVAHPGRLADVLETSVTRAMASVPATVFAVGRLAAPTTGVAAPAEAPRDHAGKPPAGSAAAAPVKAPSAPAISQRKPAAGRHSVPLPAAGGQPTARHLSDDGGDGPAGRSWLPSCLASAASGHDHCWGSVVQSRAAERPQPSHRGNDAPHHAVPATEIQPGVTPD